MEGVRRCVPAVDPHAEALDGVGGKHAHVLLRVAGVVDVQVVLARVARDVEQGLDAVQGTAACRRQCPDV
ncbi:hypothetical protein D3C83_83200 [compost metagenome]